MEAQPVVQVVLQEEGVQLVVVLQEEEVQLVVVQEPRQEEEVQLEVVEVVLQEEVYFVVFFSNFTFN